MKEDRSSEEGSSSPTKDSEETAKKMRDFLRFQAEKMHTTLTKIGEVLDNTLFLLLLALTTTAVITVGHYATPGTITVPILQLPLQRELALIASMILTSGLIYRFFITITLYEILANKYWWVARDAYDQMALPSTLRVEYPSVIWATVAIGREFTAQTHYKWWRIYYWVLFGGLIPILFLIIPLFLLAAIAIEISFSLSLMTIVISGLLLGLATTAYLKFLGFQTQKQKDYDQWLAKMRQSAWVFGQELQGKDI